jgi:hypothetical protein
MYTTYALYIVQMYTLEIHICTSGIVMHYIGCGCQSHNLQEIHCLKGAFVFDLHDMFHEPNPAVQRDLPVLLSDFRCTKWKRI